MTTTLYERMQYVLTLHPEWSSRDWARAAGLSEESHVATILQRLRKNPNRTISIRTLTALARAGGVSAEWLSTGLGRPTGSYVLIENDPVYPTRAQAIAGARLFGWDSRAIEKVQAVRDLPVDPGLDYWRRLLEGEHLAALRDHLEAGPRYDGKPTPVNGSPASPVKRPARRKSR